MTRRKTFDEYAAQVQDLYGQRMYVIPGQEYVMNKVKLWHYCKIHQTPFLCAPVSVLSKQSATGCPDCTQDAQRQHDKYRALAKTLKFVGKVTDDGHLILEHVGYRSTPAATKRGLPGKALYRYKCACCGNTEAVALGNDLKRPGHITGCSHCSVQHRKESIRLYLHNKQAAMAPSHLYVSSVYFGDYIKIGITKDYANRAAQGNRGNYLYDKNLTPEEHYKAGNVDLSYEDCYYLSPPFPRAWTFSIEQILLSATRSFIPQKPLPKEMIEILWSGQTELRDWTLDPYKVQAAFIKLIAEIQNSGGDWYGVYSKHINSYSL